MKRLIYTFCFNLLFINPFNGMSQDASLEDNLALSRNRNIRQLLDLRFRGGSGEFEKLLINQVLYTEEARKNCVNGVVILSFTVDCDNTQSELKMRNALYYGFNEQLSAFYTATEGKWNQCSDERYTRFEIPIQFIIEGTETNGRGFVVVEEKNPGYRCKSDQYYLDNIEKFRKKGKTKRALEMIDMLIKRDPYNQTYYELKNSFFDKQD